MDEIRVSRSRAFCSGKLPSPDPAERTTSSSPSSILSSPTSTNWKRKVVEEFMFREKMKSQGCMSAGTHSPQHESIDADDILHIHLPPSTGGARCEQTGRPGFEGECERACGADRAFDPERGFDLYEGSGPIAKVLARCPVQYRVIQQPGGTQTSDQQHGQKSQWNDMATCVEQHF